MQKCASTKLIPTCINRLLARFYSISLFSSFPRLLSSLFIPVSRSYGRVDSSLSTSSAFPRSLIDRENIPKSRRRVAYPNVEQEEEEKTIPRPASHTKRGHLMRMRLSWRSVVGSATSISKLLSVCVCVKGGGHTHTHRAG